MKRFEKERMCDSCHTPIKARTPAQYAQVFYERKSFHYSCYAIKKIKYYEDKIKKLKENLKRYENE